MTRWLGCTALVAVLAVGLVVGADKGTDTKDKDKNKEESKAARAFAELQLKLNSELSAEKDEAKRKAVCEKYSPTFLDHAKNNPKDDSAVLALEAVLQLSSPKDKVKARQEAIVLLEKEYVKSKQIMPILRSLAILAWGITSDAGAKQIIEAVAKNNPDKLIRATALDEMASSMEFRAVFAASLARNEKRLAQYESQYGQDFVNKFLDSADESKKEAEVLRKTLDTDYAGVLKPKDEPKETPKGGTLDVGAKAPEVDCADLSGGTVKLSDYKGKVVVLDFWATWCGPCRAMIPHTRELVKQHEKKPFVFVSVSCDAERETLENFTKKTEMPWTHWWDGQGGKVARTYEVRAFPTIYVVDHKGVIQFKSVGFDKKLDSVVEKLIKEAEADKK